MPLTEGQVQIRNLIMGRGTSYHLLEFNPWSRDVRADQGDARAWNHGGWSGAEWQGQATVPMRIRVLGTSAGSWLGLHQQLMAAFAPVGDVASDVELRWVTGGVEYMLFGRPRLVDPEARVIGHGQVPTRAGFVALDPRIYSGILSTTGAVGLPSHAGGLVAPLTVPFNINSTLVGGAADLVNAGTAATGLSIRIDGPVSQPRITVRQPDGTLQQITFLAGFVLPAGQWIEIDTAARTALLNGLPQASVRGQASWEMDPFPVPPGTSVLRFGASSGTGIATATYRSAWW
jgi:hypothetical protein